MGAPKYRRKNSYRLKGWDYSDQGWYFVTFNTKHRIPYLGKIVDGKMQFSEVGKVARDQWKQTPSIRSKMNIQLGAFVVMPDHFHGIIGIGENRPRGAKHRAPTAESQHRAPTAESQHRAPTAESQHRAPTTNSFGPQSHNLASIIRGYKSAVTTFARINGFSFQWQRNYYDRIIRNEQEYHRISRYIAENPSKWKKK
jgi:REP element-mobilizing transposase RayT